MTSGAERADPPPAAGTTAPTLALSTPELSPRLERVAALAGEIGGWLARPRVRLAMMGVVLLVIGGLVVTSSVWTLPLVC
jgi:hypothetical protein